MYSLLSAWASTLLLVPAVSMLDMETLDTMGDRLAAARKDARMSRPQLAKQCGLTRAAIQQWENGTVKAIRPVNLLRVCEVLGIEVRWLVTGEGPRRVHLPDDKRVYSARWAALLQGLSLEQIATMIPILEATVAAQKKGLLLPVEHAEGE